jgi:predicted SprT family Zn-dependent metalloprotease
MTCNDLYIAEQSAINDLFDFLNGAFFENALSKSVLTIQRADRGCYGWFTAWSAWQSGDLKSTEINLCADYLDRPPLEVIGTILHEMCHLWAFKFGIKDTSRSGVYHNAKFKQIAEGRGLILEKDKKRGYVGRGLTEVAQKAVEPFLTRLVSLRRVSPVKPDKKCSSTRKYVCPSCGISVRATREVAIMCVDCNENMGLASE